MFGVVEFGVLYDDVIHGGKVNGAQFDHNIMHSTNRTMCGLYDHRYDLYPGILLFSVLAWSLLTFKMDSRKGSHWQIDEEDNESIVEDRPSASQIEGSEPPDHSEEITPPADPSQEALRDVYGDLTDKLHSPSLVEHLYAARILTVVEYETINSRGSNHAKNTEVLAAMRRRSQNEVLQFCQFLFTHNQHNCGRIVFAGSIVVEHLCNIRVYTYTAGIEWACHAKSAPT